MMRPLGPGMMQQIQQPCSNCNQSGYSVPSYDMCSGCHSKVSMHCLVVTDQCCVMVLLVSYVNVPCLMHLQLCMGMP